MQIFHADIVWMSKELSSAIQTYFESNIQNLALPNGAMIEDSQIRFYFIKRKIMENNY